MGLPIWSAGLADYSLLASGVLLVVAGLLSVAIAQGSLRQWLPRRLVDALIPDPQAGHDEQVDASHRLGDLDRDLELAGTRLAVDDVSLSFGGVKAVRGVTVAAEPGGSIMQAALAGDVPGIDAICGGACACATCHVFIGEAYRNLLPPPAEDERAMLEFVSGAGFGSRLSCQLTVEPSLDGIEVRTPESQQ